MDEMRSAYGLLNLHQVNNAIFELSEGCKYLFCEALRPVEGVAFFDDMPGVRHNYSYFPIFIDSESTE